MKILFVFFRVAFADSGEMPVADYQLEFSKSLAAEALNQTAGCVATFKTQSSTVVVKDANAKQYGYHFADLASDQNLSVEENVQSLSVVGCCEVTVFPKLNYQGESKAYKAGTHTDVMQEPNSVRLKPLVCLNPIWKKLEAKCEDEKVLHFSKKSIQRKEHDRAKQRVMRDPRVCTAPPLKAGACRDKTGKWHKYNYPQACQMHLDGLPKPEIEAYKPKDCMEACTAMKAIAYQVDWAYDFAKRKRQSTISNCLCYFAGPRWDVANKERGPADCPCPFKSRHGGPNQPREGNSAISKRGDIEPNDWQYPGRSECAPISCEGPEPPPPPTPSPLPLPAAFSKLPKCPDTWQGREGFQAMQSMLRDKRVCTASPLKDGACRDKTGKWHKYNYPQACQMHLDGLPKPEIEAYKPKDCMEACIAMKAIGYQVDWTYDYPKQKRRIPGKVSDCQCYFAGPRWDEENKEKGATHCPCGFITRHGGPNQPREGNSAISKRGDIEPNDWQYPGRSQCAPITCDGPDPTAEEIREVYEKITASRSPDPIVSSQK